ncbi:unnamed protein product, partial [Adineta steineri]
QQFVQVQLNKVFVEAMKKIISKQCTGFNPNEHLLFHGTKDDGIKGIAEDGFDDRFFIPTGAWGNLEDKITSDSLLLSSSFTYPVITNMDNSIV